MGHGMAEQHQIKVTVQQLVYNFAGTESSSHPVPLCLQGCVAGFEQIRITSSGENQKGHWPHHCGDKVPIHLRLKKRQLRPETPDNLKKGNKRLEVRSTGLPAESINALQSGGPRRIL